MKMRLLGLFVFWMCCSSPTTAQNPTWTNGVACIVYSHCTSCHNPKGVAPFSLTRYDDVFANRFSVAAAIQAGNMPPFPPSQDKQKYAHANTLSPQEKQAIVAWVNNFAPIGDANNIPAEPTYSASYQLTNPDQILQIPSYTVNTTNDLYRVFVLPINNPTQKFISEVEVVPGNREIVHHALIFQDTSSIPMQLDNNDPLPGYTAFGGTGSSSSKLITGYTPGQGLIKYPPGFGALVLPQSYICLQIHYPGGITNQIDSTQIRIRYGPTTLRNLSTTAALNHQTSLTNGPLFIPANTVKTFYSQLTVPVNRTVTGIMPHMHLLGKSIKAYCKKPNGDTIHLVDIPNWDFHWQGFYSFQKPILVPAGSVLYGEATYDNTAANLHNPNAPPQNVSQGEGTGDEMMLIYFNVASYQAGDTAIIIDTLNHLNHYNQCSSEQQPMPISNINIYPNPANGYFMIDGAGNLFDIFLYNASGQEVLRRQQVNKQTAIPTYGIGTGKYYLKIQEQHGGTSYKALLIK